MVLLFNCRAFRPETEGGTLLFTSAAVAVVCLAATRWIGLRVVRDEPGTRARQRLRFSLRTVFACIVISALAVRAAQELRHFAMTHDGWRPNVAFGGAAVGATLVSMAAVWAVLSPGRPWLRLLVVAGLAPLAGMLPAYFCGDDAVFWPLVKLTSAEAAVTAGSLAVVRACEFRLVKTRSGTSTSSSAIWAPWRAREGADSAVCGGTIRSQAAKSTVR
jgi:hypothetical protein